MIDLNLCKNKKEKTFYIPQLFVISLLRILFLLKSEIIYFLLNQHNSTTLQNALSINFMALIWASPMERVFLYYKPMIIPTP